MYHDEITTLMDDAEQAERLWRIMSEDVAEELP
jgi:hypothetical protein